MKHIIVSLAAFSLLALTGCVDRATADAKLVKACTSAIEAFAEDGESVEKINSQNIKDHMAAAGKHRLVELDVAITDGFHGRDDTASCIFFEEFGFANMSHRASIYSFSFNGQTIGQDNYEIQGSLEDMTKLTDAVDKALK